MQVIKIIRSKRVGRYRQERLAVLDDGGTRAIELDDGPDAQ